MSIFFISPPGHAAKITGLSYVYNSPYYLSADSANLILLNDIRNGEIYSSISYATDSNGVVSVSTLTSGVALIITKVEIILINVFTLA